MNDDTQSSARCPAPAAELPQSRRFLETAVVFHVATLAVFCSWAFGGNAYWSRLATGGLATLGIGFTVAALFAPHRAQENRRVARRCLWPLALFNVLVIVSCFNPSFRSVTDETHLYYVRSVARADLPSTARPDLSLRSLWFFDAVYLSCFNLMLVVRQRRVLRRLLLAVAVNAVLLAIFGTVQKLLGAPAPFFADERPVQPLFFGPFLYHNHWGAHTVLMIAISSALVFHFARNVRSRDFWHSPGFTGLLAIMLLAMTVPLSGSRSSVVLVALLLVLALAQWCVRLALSRRRDARRWLSSVAVALGLLGLTVFFGYQLARPMIAARLKTTYQQVEEVRANPSAFTRATLYRDTWHMAREHPWFGWGLASYPTVFYLFNSLRFPHPVTHPDIELNFRDAHSDWLQSVAEVGFVGTSLVILCAWVPLWHRRHGLLQSWLSGSLLTGLGVVLLYAAVEFPFGNGAVIVAFWLCFFCAVHYPRAESADPVPQLA